MSTTAVVGPALRLPQSRLRGPGMVYTALSVGLVVLLAVFSLTSRQAASPTVAELTPRTGARDTNGSTVSRSGAESAAHPPVEQAALAASGLAAAAQSATPAPRPSATPNPANVTPSSGGGGASPSPAAGGGAGPSRPAGPGSGSGGTGPGGSGPGGSDGSGAASPPPPPSLQPPSTPSSTPPPPPPPPIGEPGAPEARAAPAVRTGDGTTAPTTSANPDQVPPTPTPTNTTAANTNSTSPPATTNPTAPSGPNPGSGPGPNGPVTTTTTVVAATTTTTGTVPATTTTTPTASTTTTTVPEAVFTAPCFSPERQIEDPQSPPCISRYAGPKPTSAAKGVDDNTIRIAYPKGIQVGYGNARVPDIWTGMETFVNNHFMLYGRKIKFVDFQPRDPGDAGGSDPGLATADAAVVNSNNVFAAAGTWFDGGGYNFEDALAQQRVVSSSGKIPPADQAHLKGLDPYLWSYPPPLRTMEESVGAWICQQLATSAPTVGQPELGFAPPPTRTFGLIANVFADNPTDTKPLEDKLASCNVTIDPQAKVQSLYSSLNGPQAATSEVLRLKNAKVTSVICICHVNALRGQFQPAARDQSYYPEWIVTSFLHNDFSAAVAQQNSPTLREPTGVPDETKHSFGLSFRPRALEADRLPITRALTDSFSATGGWNWKDINSGTSNEWTAQMWNWMYYKSVLLLASGIQMAGPDLSAESFARGQKDAGGNPVAPFLGLQGTTFPNPVTGDLAGKVGFDGPGGPDHSMVNDGTAIWYKPDQDSTIWGSSDWGSTGQRAANPAGANQPFVHLGAWCYVSGGRRSDGFGDWTSASPSSFFTPPCDG